MNAQTPFVTAADLSAGDLAEDLGGAGPCALVERQLQRLERLADAGMEMIEALTAQAKGTGPQVVEGDVALAFGRVSRAVRMAMLQQAELAGRKPEAAGPSPREAKQAHVERAVRIVRRVARDHCRQEPFAVTVIAREAAERLDDDDIYGLAQTRPVGELVALICRDLGLQPDWDALAAEAWAKAEIASGAEGSPFLDEEEEEDERPPPQAGEGDREAVEGASAAMRDDLAFERRSPEGASAWDTG